MLTAVASKRGYSSVVEHPIEIDGPTVQARISPNTCIFVSITMKYFYLISFESTILHQLKNLRLKEVKLRNSSHILLTRCVK